MRLLAALAVLALALAAAAPALAQAAGLAVAPSPSRDGVYQLSWSANGPVRVEESRTQDFAELRVVYEGRDNATTLSGREDGTYWYRAVPSDADAGAATVVSVDVEHHSLARALTFFAIGLVVFASTVALVVQGNRSHDDG